MQDYTKLFKLAGTTALVTGGTSGLGFAIAEALLQNGADVAVCGRDIAKAAPLAAVAEACGQKLQIGRAHV